LSNLPERSEKICLNCKAALEGRFCHICGQENIEPRETFWNMITHFVFDLFHFDGKFFSTLKYLLIKPGFLSQVHLRGRRATYLHPIRMYVFTSAFFFLIFFNFFQNKQTFININQTTSQTVASDIEELNTKKLQLGKSQVALNKLFSKRQSDSLQAIINQIDNDILILQRDSTMKGKVKSLNKEQTRNVVIAGDTIRYSTLAQYDSIQSKLPPAERKRFIGNRFTRQWLYLNEKYDSNIVEIKNAVVDKFLHSIPTLLFISLPLFALLLYLLYWSHKQYFYSDHVVYTLHLYCAFFIFIFSSLVLSTIIALINKSISEWVSGLFTLILLFYWYKSIRYFYAQSRGKSILKFILLLIANLFLLMLLFISFFIFSAMTI